MSYARATGRGRYAEADSSWGDTLANDTITQKKTIVQRPVMLNSANRLLEPYLLGIPLKIERHLLGVFVLIRFGGPEFSPQGIALAEFLAEQISQLLERQFLAQENKNLEIISQEITLQDDFISTITHETANTAGVYQRLRHHPAARRYHLGPENPI